MAATEHLNQVQFYEGHMAPGDIKPRQRGLVESKVTDLARRMAVIGYDGLPPIETTSVDGDVRASDGHHRRAAAIRAGLPSVPVYGMSGRGIPAGMTEIGRERYDEHWNAQ